MLKQLFKVFNCGGEAGSLYGEARTCVDSRGASGDDQSYAHALLNPEELNVNCSLLSCCMKKPEELNVNCS
ncbi:hypothetical protein L1987_06488 [Smallanthus sonchifolius]|uniref:Uncharacterized protein n=1 Tax=Smallanthus sonchifolius TaxID=185202 RepID=A0ACB9JYA0_9ASTR|nr:hypothetical protein L1987_06488 [Smallanthus sonchifolius]